MSRKASTHPNLARIAKQLNVSIPTVWRAIRNAQGIHPETRSKIMQAAAEMGYVSPARAGSSTQARPHNILALSHCLSPTTSQGFTTGISRASLRYNLNVLTHHLEANQCETLLDPAFQPQAMKSGGVDGIILIHYWPQEVAKYISSIAPTVSVVHQYFEIGIEHVGIDDRMGMRSLVKHLYDGGHRRIGFFGMCRDVSWASSRFAAYFASLADLDLEYDSNNVIEISREDAIAFVPFPSEKWEKQVLKQIKHKTDAWICSSAGTANTFCRFLMNHNIKMPEDVSLAGFHQGITDTAPDLPLITSTIVSEAEIGAAAVQRLMNRMEYINDPPRSTLLPCIFAEGNTTRKPAKK